MGNRSKNARIVPLVFLCGLLTAVIGCDNPIQPGETPRSITIVGNATFEAPGASTQLTVRAILSSGEVRDVTTEASYRVSNGAVATVAFGGRVTAAGYGRTEITATYKTQTATLPVQVLPAGTFLVTGTVTQAGSGLPVAGAAVQATSRAGTFSTVTASTGQYAVPAVGNATVRIEKVGFEAKELQATVNAETQLDLELGSFLAGASFTLVFTASSSCSLPSESTTRQYVATFPPDVQGTFVVKLSGANFDNDLADPGFSGTMDANGVRFEIVRYAFAEILPGSRELSYDGTANGTISGTRIEATFNGLVRLFQYDPQRGGETTLAQCQAADHHFVFVR